MKCKKIKDTRSVLVGMNILFALIFIVLPLYSLFRNAFLKKNIFVGFDNFKKYFSEPNLVKSITNSIEISFCVSIIALIFAFLFVYGIKRTNIKLKKIFKWVPIILFSIPTIIHSIFLICIFGKNGVVSNMFSRNFNVYGKFGLIICNILYVFPVLYSLLFVAFDNIDYRLYEAAEIMGTKELKKFLTITLPNMKFTIVNGFFSAFILVFTDFGAAKVIGGNYSLISIDIYEQIIGQQNISMGAVSAIILMVPAILFFILEHFINKRNYTVDSCYKFLIKRNIVRDFIFQIYNLLILLFVVLEIVIIAIMSLVYNWPYNLKFTLKWYMVKSYGISVSEIYINTIMVAFLSALIGTIIVFIVAYLVGRYKETRFSIKLLYNLYKLPLTIPGLSIGLAYIIFFNNKENLFNFIYGTFTILILVNIIHFFSVPFLNILGVMKKINNTFEDVSEVLGVPWYINVRKVILPLSIPVIIESFLYYFINSMITVSAVIFLYSSYTRLASIEIVNKIDMGNLQSSCAISLIIIFTNIIVSLLLNKLTNKMKNKYNF